MIFIENILEVTQNKMNSLVNNLNQDLDMNLGSNLEASQNSFLKSALGNVINQGVNLGIRALLPNVIEDQVIEIKDAILNNGFKAGVKQAVNSAINLGKSSIGILTGKFENIEQARNAVKNGGLIDSVSILLDKAINKANNKNLIPDQAAYIIKKGKNSILDAINNNIEDEFFSQIETLEYISKYENNWKNYYKEKDFDGMEREYQKIKTGLKKVMPIETTLKDARTLENLHLLIKNKGKNFDLSKEEIELANQLVSWNL